MNRNGNFRDVYFTSFSELVFFFCFTFPGNHKVSVKYGGKHAPGSPFKVAISPKSDASKVKVSGPGVEKTGVQPGKPTWFTINASEAGKGDVHVKVEPVGKFPSVKFERESQLPGVSAP